MVEWPVHVTKSSEGKLVDQSWIKTRPDLEQFFERCHQIALAIHVNLASQLLEKKGEKNNEEKLS